MKKWNNIGVLILLLAFAIGITACEDSNDPGTEGPTETDFTDLLSNQVNEIILPSMLAYQTEMGALESAVSGFASSIDEASLAALRAAYQDAYLAYQAVAVHNYYATANQNLVNSTNLFPIEVDVLEDFVTSKAYNFNTTAQERANGFPAIDYMLYGPSDILAYFDEDANRLSFLEALVDSMKAKADALVEQWSGSLKQNFIENGGTALGSSISVQLNESLVYYEVNIRENKVGIPIGRLGPNDSPITPDATKIEALYQAQRDGNEDFTLALLRAAIEEMEDMYLGETSTGADGQGYDNLLLVREQSAIDEAIKAQYQTIYTLINSRTSISGDRSLYDAVQALVTLYKSDLFPVLDVQDADGSNDGD